MDSFFNARRTKIKKPDSIANSDQNYSEQHSTKGQDFDYNSEPVYSSSRLSKPKAIITLNIGDSLEQIKVYEGQDLYEIAGDFAHRHDLNEDFIDFLVENIKSQMNEHDKKTNKSFLSNLDQLRVSETPENFKRNEKELHYENWQKLLKEKMANNYNVTNNNKPQMNKNSQKTSKNSSPRQRSVSPIRNPSNNVTEKLFNESKIMKKKQINSEKIKEESELKNCSFKPKINDNSKKIIQRDKSNKSIHEKLYEETSFINEKKEKERKAELSKNYPFKPNISPLKNSKTNTKSQQELTARLLNSKKETEKTIFNMKKKELNDNNTSFTPQITKDKYYLKAKEKEDIELENYMNLGNQLTRIQPEKIQQPPKPQEKPKINNIFDEYLNILRNIFNGMDDDNDGMISSEKIDLSKIDPDFLEIIQDILLKVDEEKSWLNFQRFLNQIEENHLEVKIHNWMSKNYTNFEKLDSLYENMNPKHIQQFSFGGLDPAFEVFKELQKTGRENDISPKNDRKPPIINPNNNINVKMGDLTSRYKNLIKNLE